MTAPTFTRLTIPPEPGAITSLDVLAPGVRGPLERTLEDMDTHGMGAIVRETQRTDARQQWLYGFGRSYDDGRGIVTYAQSARQSWHYFRLAADVVHKTLEDRAPWEFWERLAAVAEAYGLAAGQRWKDRKRDAPHLQYRQMRVSPSPLAYAAFVHGGAEAVWRIVGAGG